MYWQYLKYLARHKWYVFVECCKVGIPIRGLLHDMSKFRPSEYRPYARYFYGTWMENSNWHGDWRNVIPYEDTQDGVEKAFDFAWLMHQKRNPHHWQYWLLVNDSSSREFTIGEPGSGYELFLCRNNRPLAIFDISILWKDDIILPESGNNDNAYLYAKEIKDKLNKFPAVFEMPLKYRKEMLADWRGAGRAINGRDETKEWYLKNKDNMILGTVTREWVEEQLGVVKGIDY